MFLHIDVEVFIAEEDFRVYEKNTYNPNEPALMPVMVAKISKIANPIVLDIIPLTVDMARADTHSVLPENIPNDNPYSPPFAGNVEDVWIL